MLDLMTLGTLRQLCYSNRVSIFGDPRTVHARGHEALYPCDEQAGEGRGHQDGRRAECVPGTGFEPVCLSAARFKFDLAPSWTVRGCSWESRPPWAAPLRRLVNRGELQPLLQPRPLVANSGRHGHERSFEAWPRSRLAPFGRCWLLRLLQFAAALEGVISALLVRHCG
jgi:hypothetical protein